MSMIQIGCLLVGQTLNITILSRSVAVAFLLRVFVYFLCSKWHSKIIKTTVREEKRERFESKTQS